MRSIGSRSSRNYLVLRQALDTWSGYASASAGHAWVSLSIGSTDPVDFDYLAGVRALAHASNRTGYPTPLLTGIEDATCTISCASYTKKRCLGVSRVGQIQDALGRRSAGERVQLSRISRIRDERMEFLREVAERADCANLLDINNIYVSASITASTRMTYCRPSCRRVRHFILPVQRSRRTSHDTHDHPIVEPVWNLYRAAVAQFGAVRP